MNSIGSIFQSLGDYALFRSMVNYVDSRIAYFTESTLANVLTVVGFFALILLTLWIIWYGYQIVMGSTQHTARDFAYKAVRAWIIIAFATGLAASMGFSIRTVTTDLSNMVSSALTGSDAASACVTNVGNNSFTGCKIDKNLVRMQAAMAFVNQLDTGADPVLEDKKTRASLMTAAGIGGPAIVAGGLLLTLKVAMALFIALGPIFIMCLLFKPTTPLFQKWLYYGLSTMFATAMFAVVSDIAMDLVENTTAALFVSDLFTTTLDPTGASNAAAAGIMNASVQQLGLGLMLSTLLITTPPMAANFFNGVMGSFNYNSAFGSFGSAKAPAQNGAPGTPGNPGAPASPAATNTTQTRAGGDIAPPTSTQPYIPSNNAAVNKDVIKTDSPMGNASKGFASSEVLQADRTIKDPPAPTAPTSPKVDKT
jgi:type IV secretion system protein VirB6